MYAFDVIIFLEQKYLLFIKQWLCNRNSLSRVDDCELYTHSVLKWCIKYMVRDVNKSLVDGKCYSGFVSIRKSEITHLHSSCLSQTFVWSHNRTSAFIYGAQVYFPKHCCVRRIFPSVSLLLKTVFLHLTSFFYGCARLYPANFFFPDHYIKDMNASPISAK